MQHPRNVTCLQVRFTAPAFQHGRTSRAADFLPCFCPLSTRLYTHIVVSFAIRVIIVVSSVCGFQMLIISMVQLLHIRELLPCSFRFIPLRIPPRHKHALSGLACRTGFLGKYMGLWSSLPSCARTYVDVCATPQLRFSPVPNVWRTRRSTW